MSMNLSWKVVIVFSGIFLAGAITGGAVGVYWSKKLGPRPGMRNPAEQFRAQMAKTAQRLELTDLQREQIKPAIAKAGEEFRRLHKGSLQESHDIIERLNAEVAKVLTPEQAAKFEEIRTHQFERMRSFQMGSHNPKHPDDSPNLEPHGVPQPAPAPADAHGK